MKTPVVSCPTSPPKAHVFFITDKVSMQSYSYAELFVAKYWIDALTSHDYKWIDDNTIEMIGNNRTFRIRSHQLEDILEYRPTKAERAYRPEWCFQSMINKLKEWDNPHYHETPKKTQPTAEAPKPTISRNTQKRRTDNKHISVAQMADDLNISAGKARTALRKAKEPKPTQGWTYETDTDEANRIFDIIKASIN